MNFIEKAASSTISILNELGKNNKSSANSYGYDNLAIVSPNPEEELLICSLDNVLLFPEDFCGQNEPLKRKDPEGELVICSLDNVPLFPEDFCGQNEPLKRKDSNDEEQITTDYPASVSDQSSPCIVPRKKRKTSNIPELARSQKSYCSLVSAFFDVKPSGSCQPKRASQFINDVFPDIDCPRGGIDSKFSKDFNCSLIFQLHYVSSTASSESSASPTQSLENISCANSCESHICNKDSWSSEYMHKSNKAQYGWFVELDDNDNEEAAYAAENCYKKSAGCDLAFKASTAPKRSHYEDQVEWAYAADTVDDVLGDFF